MKRLLTVIGLIVLTLTASAANKSWTLSQSTCKSSSGDDSPWTFNNGFSISENNNKKLAFNDDDGIKYSAGVQYTINIPSGESIKRITFTGYDNYADTDSYLGELNGTQYNSTGYVWPKKDANGNTTPVSHTITFSTDVTGTLTFTPKGKQVVWRIILYNYEDTPVNPDQPVTVSQMETLDRGLVALPAQGGTGNFVSWRLLGTDDKTKTTFDLKRGGTTIATDLTVTNYTDTEGTTSSQYQVITKVDGTITETSDAVSPWTDVYKKLVLDRPATVGSVTYSPNDCSVGDVDGDGQYELFVKWDPSNSKDNSKNGETDKVYIDCYRLDGTKLWRIDLGYNIRAGAHYTQFLVYDFDGDGRAELICKTAPGTKDGTGAYVSAAATDSDISSTDNSTTYRNDNGHILTGPEFLTVFNGETGAAVHTVFYNPNRAGSLGGAPSHPSSSFWGDNYGGRSDRYLGAVAFLDGATSTPSAIFCRGYYTRAYVWAVKFNGTQLTTKWLHASTSTSQYSVTDADDVTTNYTPGTATRGSGSNTLYANGNHNLSVADVDDDGCDEIIWGSGALDQDGKLLYATGFGHGDAIHLADHNPDRPGLEVFQIHEESSYGWDLHDAATGEILFSATGSKDNGRGIAAQLSGDVRGSWFSSSNDRNQRSAVTGEVVKEKSSTLNFRIYWDGDLQDELLDGNVIDKWNGSSFARLFTVYNAGPGNTCNSTKETPNLQADILGDWREELVLWAEEDGGCVLGIYSTNIPTAYRVPTLMHDHTYRMGITWQNTAYNQPPHLGYYLPDAVGTVTTPIVPATISEVELQATDEGILLPVVSVANSDFTIDDVAYTPTLSATFTNLSGVKQAATLQGETLYFEDFEGSTEVGDYWKNSNEGSSIFTPTYANSDGQCIGIKSDKDRGDYTPISANYSGISKYAIEFDAYFNNASKTTDLAVMSKSHFSDWTYNYGYRWKTSTTETHNPFLLFLQRQASSTTFKVNETESTITLSNSTWYHFTLTVDVTAQTVKYSISPKGGTTVTASGTYTLPEDESAECDGIYIRNGRNNYAPGGAGVDNIHVYDASQLKYTFTRPGTLTVTSSYIGYPSATATYSADFIGTKISAAGWTTLGCKYPLAFSDTGLDAAYIVDAGNSTDESAKLLVVNSVPASTGLLLQGTAGTYRLPIETSPDPLETTNKLTAVTAKSGYTATDATYVLAKKSNGVGFYQCSAGVKVPVGKAYLTLGNNARPFFGFDETTGIILIDESRFMVHGESGTAYDLQGRRIGQPMQRGLYIVDGKKYFKM